MNHFRIAAFLAALLVLSACGDRLPVYKGPEVTRIVVFKEKRSMYLLHGNMALKSYRIDLGFDPVGDKVQSGDGKTPEGHYLIDRRNPESSFYLSIGLNYPDAADMAEAKALGVDPGGDIFIHGESSLRKMRGTDWTQGCISVSNKEMREIYVMVRDGTPISIYP